MVNYPSIVFSDVDGTLLNKERRLSFLTTKTIHTIAQEYHTPFVMVTARMPKGVYHFYRQLNLNSPVICYNGALILKNYGSSIFEKNDILYTTSIEYNEALSIYHVASNLDLHFGIFNNNSWNVNKPDFWTSREENNTGTKATINKNIDEYIDTLKLQNLPIHKIMVMGEKVALDKLIKETQNCNISSASFYRSKDTYLEITPSKVNKAKACNLVLSSLNLKAENSLAFGDNVNDVEMLLEMGSGFAMGNSPLNVKKVVGQVAPSNVDDGVAFTIKKIFNV
ncbi:MAG: HAD family phosphatase [Bacteroidales bacterium]|nr:HAD family phosphatase [Bacteroidales bacterium]